MTTVEEMRGRTALVTGAGTGIGAEFAARLAAAGAHLILVARSGERLEALAWELRDRHRVDVRPMPTDLSRPGAAAELAGRVERAGTAVEMLVNSAGVAGSGPVADADPAAAAAMISVNCTALTELTMSVLPAMIGRGRGSVVNVASTGSFQPAPYLAVYAATKAYALSFTQALWAETRTSGVRVLAVCPGPTDTPMNPGSGRGKRTSGQVVETTVRALARGNSSVVDGRTNALFARTFSRRFPERAVLMLGERLMRPGDA